MSTERDETHVLLVRDKPLNAIKADLIHAFLSVSVHIDEPNNYHNYQLIIVNVQIFTLI